MLDKLVVSTEHDFRNLRIFLKTVPECMIYQTTEYANLISNHLCAESKYLAIKEDDKFVGVIPIMLKKNNVLGNIINSHPFYGSHGGVLVSPNLSPSKKILIKTELLKLLSSFIEENSCVASTIITSPLDRNQMFYFDNLKYDYLDNRVSQIVVLPQFDKDLRGKLLSTFTASCGRAIRKAEKIGVTVNITAEKGKILDEFYEIYAENMKTMNAPYKKKKYFEHALDGPTKRLCNLRYAELNGRVIGGIFHFYYGRTVEYFQPGIHHDFRSSGATNLLVLHGMTESIKNGYNYWNFGGTPKTNETLHNFKRSFGAIDFHYHYFTQVRKEISQILSLSPQDIFKAYPDFYVVPFSELRGKND